MLVSDLPFPYFFVMGIDRTRIIQKVGKLVWRQNLNRVYKIISGQKMSPYRIRTSDSHKSQEFPSASIPSIV